MSRKKESITLSIPPGTKAKLEAIADRLNILWGKSPSVSGLLTAIAEGRYTLTLPLQIDHAEVKILHRAANNLIDTGDLEGAKSIRTLLMDYANLEEPIRRLLLEQAAKTVQVWRAEVDTAIANRQSFYLLYTNSQGIDESFTVRFAAVVFREKRHYLQAWCDETEGSGDLLELEHNRCFRFDRIRSISPCSKEWRGYLDTIDVTLRFWGGLAKAYEPKANDISDTIKLDGQRYITRRTSNVFWLCREIIGYMSGCEIVSPAEVRSRFYAELQTILQRYQTDNINLDNDHS
jgi:predicted DNA-binding transcriptional regulator YafY